MFNPPTGPTNGAEYTYGNVVWQYQNPPGVWNIKDGTLVGTDGVGVSGFRIDGTDLKFYYVYPGGVTSSEINLGTVIGAGVIDSGITFSFPFNNSTDRITLGETITIAATGSMRAFIDSGTNTIRFDNRLASTSVTGVASFNSSDFSVNTTTGQVTLSTSKTIWTLNDPKGSSNRPITLGDTVKINGIGGLTANFEGTNPNWIVNISGITATNTQIGVAYYNSGDFTVASGQVSLTSGIVNSVNGKTGSVALPLANTTGTTGLASFHSPHFIVSATGNVQSKFFTVNDGGFGASRFISPGSTLTIRGENNNQTITVKAPAGADDILDIGITDASYSVKGAALFRAGDFVVSATGSVSLTANIVNFVNGATGNLLVGAGDDKIVFTNPTGLTTSPNFVFDGRTLTFGGENTQMTITGPTFAFGDLTQVKGGVYTMFSEQATAWTENGGNTIQIDLADGTIQKIKKSNSSGKLTVTVGTPGWSNVPDKVQSVVVYVQQIGTGYTGEFHSSIIADRSVPMFGVTGGIDVFTISRYAVTNSTGLTMGFSIAVGLTGSGIAF